MVGRKVFGQIRQAFPHRAGVAHCCSLGILVNCHHLSLYTTDTRTELSDQEQPTPSLTQLKCSSETYRPRSTHQRMCKISHLLPMLFIVVEYNITKPLSSILEPMLTWWCKCSCVPSKVSPCHAHQQLVGRVNGEVCGGPPDLPLAVMVKFDHYLCMN